MKQTHSPPGSASWPQYLTHQPVRAEERPSWHSAPATIIVTHLLPSSVCCGTWEPGSFLKRTCRYENQAPGSFLMSIWAAALVPFWAKTFYVFVSAFCFIECTNSLSNRLKLQHTPTSFICYTLFFIIFFFFCFLVAHWPFVASALVNRPSVERVFFVLFLQISVSEFQTRNTFWKGNILFLFIAKSATSWGRESPCRCFFFGEWGVSLLRFWLLCNRWWSPR